MFLTSKCLSEILSLSGHLWVKTDEGSFSSWWARYGKIKYITGRIIIPVISVQYLNHIFIRYCKNNVNFEGKTLLRKETRST